VSAVITTNSTTSTVTALWEYWFKPYGYPETISFKQGNVQTSRLEKIINDLAPLKQKVTCKSRSDTFDTEVEQQWKQNQHEISEEEFVHTVNFFHELQEPEHSKDWDDLHSGYHEITENNTETDDRSEGEDESGYDLKDLYHLSNDQPIPIKRKGISLCRHKLQGRTRCRSRRWRQQLRQHEQDWFPDPEANQQTKIDLLAEETDPEWAQLREMEEYLRLQRMELLQQEAPDSDDDDWDSPQWPTENKDPTGIEEDDSLEDADLAFITSILESFSKPRSKAGKHNTRKHLAKSFCAILPPEGALTPSDANQQVTPPKFNYNSTIKDATAEKFSCFPTTGEEGSDKLAEISENQSRTETEETGFENHLQGICSITKDKKNPFAAWRPFIPKQEEPAYQNLPAQLWWPVSSAPPCSFQESTLTAISSISCLPPEEAIKPTPLQMNPDQTNHQNQIQQSPRQTWKPYRPTARHCKYSWNKHWPELSKTSKRTEILRKEFPDHQEQSKPSRLWKRRLPFADKTSLIPNMRYPNMPLETDAGGAPQLNTQCPSRICSSMTSRINTTITRSWGIKSRKWSDKISNWHSKRPAPMRPPQRNSRRTPSWDWSPSRWPPTCSSDTTMGKDGTTTRRCEDFSSWGEPFFKKKE